MPVKANSVSLKAALSWTYQKTNTGFGATEQGPESLASAPTINTTTYNHVLLTSFSLAAAASQTVDFNSFTSLVGESVTATGLLGYMVKATATTTGGQLKIEPGASNALNWPLSGTTPALTLDVGTLGATVVLQGGVSATVNGTTKNVLFSNPGTQTIQVYLGAIVDG